MAVVRPTWWGEHAIAVGDQLGWQLGPLVLRVENRPHEWRIHAGWLPDHLAPGAEVGVDVEVPAPAQISRFAARDPEERITLALALADRAVVARPEIPFHVLPGTAIQVYLSTPVWVRLLSQRGVRMAEVPTFRPSDTFYGANTREGELCYANRTHAWLDLADVPRRATRAITELELVNRAKQPLLLTRIKLPTPQLALLVGDGGTLWTPTVRVIHEEDRETLEVMIGGTPAAAGTQVAQVAAPRNSGRPNMLARAMSAFVG